LTKHSRITLPQLARLDTYVVDFVEISWSCKILYYKSKKFSKKEYCKQCRHVKFKGTVTKWPVQKQTHRTAQKHTEHQDATDIQNKLVFVFFFGFYLCLYNKSNMFQMMLNGALTMHIIRAYM